MPLQGCVELSELFRLSEELVNGSLRCWLIRCVFGHGLFDWSMPRQSFD
jgi:hypothetical protein